MDTTKIISDALKLAELGSLPEGPKGQIEAIALANVYATIAIAQEFVKLNKQLFELIGTSAGGTTKWLEVYNNAPTGDL